MYYAGTAGTAVAAFTPGIHGARTYIPTAMPAAPMSAVLPGQAYYPTMHSAPVAAAPVAYPMTAAPMVYGHSTYANYPYYHGQPTVILSSAPRGRRSRSRGGFLGYL